MTFIDTAHDAASATLHHVLTPQRQQVIIDFLLHDVLGNVIASLFLTAFLALWHLCTKRDTSCTNQAHNLGAVAPPTPDDRNEDTTPDPPSCRPPTHT